MGMICNFLEISDAQLSKLVADPDSILDFIEEERDFAEDIDKTWNGVHFLLNGESELGIEPYCYIVCGGESIGDVNVGYGPARAISSSKVRAFQEVLSKINDEDFQNRYNAAALANADVYPNVWSRPDEDNCRWLLIGFQNLKRIVGSASTNDSGLLIWLD